MTGARGLAYALFGVLWAILYYRDWQDRKIENRILVGGLALSLILGAWGLPPGSVGAWTLFGGAEAVAALTLWYFNVWPSGDAKLFMLMAAMLPMLISRAAAPSLALGFAHMVNIFIPAALYYIPQSVFVERGRRQGLGLWGRLAAFAGFVKRAIWPMGDSNKLSARLWALGFLAFMYGFGLFFYRSAGVRLTGYPVLAAILFVQVMARLMRALIWSGPNIKAKASAAGVVLIAGLCAQGGETVSWQLLRGFSLITLYAFAVEILMITLEAYFDRMETLQISPGALRPTLILADSFVERLSRDPGFGMERLGKLYPDGLLPGQVDIVQRWCQKKKIALVEVYRAHPFAFWIFLGTLLTALYEKDAVTLIRGWL